MASSPVRQSRKGRSHEESGSGISVCFSGTLNYLDESETTMIVRGEMSKRSDKITEGWYQVKTPCMEEYSDIGKLTGSVECDGNLKLQTWRDGVVKTFLKGLLVRGPIILRGKNGDGVPVEWHITFHEKEISKGLSKATSD